MTIIICIAWYLIGLYSFWYWWTKDFNITTSISDIAVFLIAGIVGPWGWVCGYVIHGNSFDRNIKKSNSKILFKKREYGAPKMKNPPPPQTKPTVFMNSKDIDKLNKDLKS